MAKVFDLGDQVRITVRTAIGGTPTSATDVAINIVDPEANRFSYTYLGSDLTLDSTGVYYYDLDLNLSGTWAWQAVGSGTVVGADTGEIPVRRTVFG